MKRVFLPLLLISVSAFAQSSQKKNMWLVAGDGCGDGLAAKVVSSVTDAVYYSNKWQDGGQVKNTPALAITCFNLDGQTVVASNFGASITADDALYKLPSLYVIKDDRGAKALGNLIFSKFESWATGKENP